MRSRSSPAHGPVLLRHDGSADADRAIRCAATLLRPKDAVLLPMPRRPFDAGGAGAGRRVALDAGFDPVVIADAGHGPGGILREARDRGASVVVVWSDRRLPPSGAIAAALVEGSDIPVLVVGHGSAPSPAGEPILIAYDGSPAARRALATAGELLAGRAAVVAAFMPAVDDGAVLRNDLPWPVAGDVRDRLAQLDREEAEAPGERAVEGARLAAAGGFLPRAVGIPGLDATGEEEGEPFRRLLRAAAAEAAACIVVAHARSTTRLESTAHALVQHADRPVLVVP